MNDEAKKPNVDELDDGKELILQDAKDIQNLLGYGKELELFVGLDGGKPKTTVIHIAPVSLKFIPELMNKIEMFQKMEQQAAKNEGFAKMTPKDIKNAAELIKMGLSKTNPGITVEQIEDVFTLDSLVQAVRLIVGVNQLSGNPMQPIRRQMQVAPTEKKSKAG